VREEQNAFPALSSSFYRRQGAHEVQNFLQCNASTRARRNLWLYPEKFTEIKMLPLKTILCPLDFSDGSVEALRTAADFAAHFDAELHLLHVPALAPPFPADFTAVPGATDEERTTQASEKLQQIAEATLPPQVRHTLFVRMGHAANEISCYADEIEADLIVISTHGATGWRHLAFGSVAESIIRSTKRPVLTVRGETPNA
jgi:universal stress protein A